MRRAVLWLTVPLVLLLVPLALVTPVGTGFVIDVAQDRLGIEIDYRSGGLGQRLELSRLRVVIDNTDVQLYDLGFELDWGCLFVSKICLADLKVERLDIGVSEGDSGPDETQSAENELWLHFPVEITARSLLVRDTLIHWPSGSWDNEELRADVVLREGKIIVSQAQADGARLSLTPSETSFEQQVQRLELPQLFLPVELVVDDLTLTSPGWSIADVHHQHDWLHLAGRWQGESVEIAAGGLQTQGWGRLDLAGTLDFSDDWPLDTSATVQLSTPPLWPILHHKVIELEVRGDLGALEVTARSDGEQTLELAGRIDSLDKYLPFDLAAKGEWSGPLPLAALLGEDFGLTDLSLLSPINLKASGSELQQEFKLTGATSGLGYDDLTVTAVGSQADRVLSFSRLSLYHSETDSALEALGAISFEPLLSWNIVADSTGISIPEVSEVLSGRLGGSLAGKGTLEDGGWTVSLTELDLAGDVNGTSALARGSLGFNDQWLLSAGHLGVEGNGANLRVDVPEGQVPAIRLDVADIGSWIEGAEGTVRIFARADESQRHFKLNGDVKELHWQGASVAQGTLAGQVDFSASQDFDLNLLLNDVIYRTMNLERLGISLRGNESVQDFSFNTRGDVTAEITGRGHNPGESWRGELHPSRVTTEEGVWLLDESVELVWNEQNAQLLIADHCWVRDESRLCPRHLELGELGQAGIELAGDFRVINQWLPENMFLQGDVQGSARVAWGGATGPEGEGVLELTSGTLTRHYSKEDAPTLKWDKAAINASLAGGAVMADATLWRDGTEQFAGRVDLPERDDQSLGGRLAFSEFQLAGVLKPFIPLLSDHRGQLNGELTLGGTATAPRFNGKLSLTEGEASLVGNPTTVEQANVVFTGQGEQLAIDGKLLLGGGNTTLTGMLKLHPSLLLEIDIEGENQVILVPPGMEATISESLQLLATLDKVELYGDINVLEGRLEHEQLPEGSIDLSVDVIEVDTQGNVVKAHEGYAVTALVNINIADSVQVEGTGLQAVVGGELQLEKKPSVPLQLFGELNIVSGEIGAFGQDLKIRQGHLSFVGEPDNPDLNFRAEREIKEEGVRVGVEVLGNLDAFALNLYSTPAMPENEIMSYLIRGRRVDKRAESDGAAVALSLGLGAVNQTGVVQGMNRIPGVSNVSFGTEGSANETAATIGGYIGEKIYLSYGVGVYEPINVLTAKFFVFPRLWLEVVSALESSADVYFSFDIE